MYMCVRSYTLRRKNLCVCVCVCMCVLSNPPIPPSKEKKATTMDMYDVWHKSYSFQLLL